MKNVQNRLVVLIFILFIIPNFGNSQQDTSSNFSFEINRIYPPISLTKQQISEANSVQDINKHYKPTWIKEFKSVEIWTIHNGLIKIAVGKNDKITKEQRDNMLASDVDADVSVLVRYIPDNTLSHIDVKVFDFDFIPQPENDARYPGGQESLTQYLKESAIDKIADNVFTGNLLAAVKFKVDEGGQIIDVNVFESSKDEKTDELLVETVCNMQDWIPAEYANGKKVQQEFVLTVGNMSSCIINLLNIDLD